MVFRPKSLISGIWISPGVFTLRDRSLARRDRFHRNSVAANLREPVPGWERPVPRTRVLREGSERPVPAGRDRFPNVGFAGQAERPGARRLVDTFVGAYEGFRHEDLRLETDLYACLPLCSFAHACEGRSLQAGTPELAIAIPIRRAGFGAEVNCRGKGSFLEWGC
uniref:Uncharacterized protein n=1 Tax=Ananas comosus var. bracteatus TaxID=296719 RepID=A0A6V7PS71_ANACO|nr:unnamed protein product [Ananas comosus var. bracteatus]